MNPIDHSVLLVDAGNTRIKWRAVRSDKKWSDQNPAGIVRTGDWDVLEKAWGRITPSPNRAMVSNVAGQTSFERLEQLTQQITGRPCERFQASRLSCGLLNAYRPVEQLGSDRWAAAIGAIKRYPGRALLVAGLGTATTVDMIVPAGLAEPIYPGIGDSSSASGVTAIFLGGLILPGIELMRQSLSRGTAQLPEARGRYASIPNNTDDAIVSGILNAQAGALERLHRYLTKRLPEQEAVLGLITGGAADALLAALADGPLDNTLIKEEQLVLHGLHFAFTDTQ